MIKFDNYLTLIVDLLVEDIIIEEDKCRVSHAQHDLSELGLFKRRKKVTAQKYPIPLRPSPKFRYTQNKSVMRTHLKGEN